MWWLQASLCTSRRRVAPASQGGGSAISGLAFSVQTDAANATYPFSTGVLVAEGAAPSNINTDLSNYQVNVLSRWPDGSVKHAMVSGRASMTSTPATVTVASGTPQTGTALTRSQLETAITAAADTSISCGAFGAVDVVDILTSGFVRTFVSGHEMIECHYAADVGGGTNLRACFQIRYYADGRLWVRETIENGKVGGSANADRTYDVTFTIGGATVYSTTGMLHLQTTRVTRTGWIGGDPQVTCLHSAAYCSSTGLIPNYWRKTPGETFLNGLPQSYTPMSFGPYPLGSGAISGGGAGDWIAHQPRWASLYCSYPDKRTQRYMIAAAEAFNACGIVYRDASTNRVPRPGNWASLLTLGSGGGNGIANVGSGGNVREWEYAHHPGEAYSAWLFTGDFFHWETQAYNSFMCYGTNSVPIQGSGTTRVIGSQVRAICWALRTFGLCVGSAPDEVLSGEDAQVVTDWRALLAANYSYWAGRVDAAGMNPLGSLYNYSLGSWTTTGSEPAFMQAFWVGVNGWLSDLQPLTDMTDMLKVRDWMYRRAVGLTGLGNSDQYYWAYAGRYGVNVNDDNTTNATTYYTDWGQVWAATHGSANAETTTSLQGASGAVPSLPDGYWGNFLPAISYAATHGVPGAYGGYSRMSGAANWSTFENSGFDEKPQWGILPRSHTSALAQACAAMTVGQWLLYADDSKGWTSSIVVVGGDTITNYGAKGHYDYRRREAHFEGQGHQQNWRHVKFSEASDTWSLVDELAYPGETDLGHNFDQSCMDEAGNIYRRRYNSTTFEKYTASSATWAAVASVPANDGIIASLVWHAGMKRVVYFCAGQLRFYNPVANSWASGGTISGLGSYSTVSAYCATQDVVVIGGGSGAETAFRKIDNQGAVTTLATLPAGIAISDSGGHLVEDPVSGKVLLFDNTVSGGSQAAFPIYEYTFGADSWSAQVGTGPTLGMLQAAVIPLHAYGRIMVISSNPRSVYLYRHA